MHYTPLSLTARTLYAELSELALGMGLASDMGKRPGSLVRKTVKGRDYLYYQYLDLAGQRRQAYLGASESRAARVIEQALSLSSEEREDRTQLQKLRAAFIGAGGTPIDTAPARVLVAFAEAGIFRPSSEYGVLVGTLAFHVYGNLLGVRWASPTRTQDIDIAGQSDIGLAIPQPDEPLPDVLARLEMGFVPVPPLNPKAPSTSFRVRGRELRVDLLTPEIGKAKGVRRVPALKSRATALRFLDYLIEDTMPAVAIGRKQLALVNVPHPERFALHKLLVSENRPPAFAAKSEKDRVQALQLLAVLREEAPDGLAEAVSAIEQRGTSWRSRLVKALDKCAERHPAETDFVRQHLS
ncbi:GSU2403 family nucleotidyltransferase fold protein [Natronospira sp.]|uniref:GSU2403 family nucleotidyltransferase fold protein n=1 Tax=Natronospira sp. TaxID=2024970 RepID=UPI00387309F0